MIRNINPSFGDSVEFDTVEEMAAAIRECGYNVPADGLREGRDFEYECGYNLTSLTDGIWNDVETFDTLEEARDFIKEAIWDEDDGDEWALVPDDGNAPEYHADTLKDLLARLG